MQVPALLLRALATARASLAIYDRTCISFPIATKAATGGALTFFADFNAQRIELARRNELAARVHAEREPFRFDGRRSAAFTSMSTFWTGLVNHWWYGMLEVLLPQAAGGWRTVAAKVALSQFVANPFLYLPTFYLWTGAILGRPLAETRTKAQNEYWEVLRACWLVMGTANAACFAIVPVQLQTSFMAVAVFVYNNVLSLIANRDRARRKLD